MTLILYTIKEEYVAYLYDSNPHTFLKLFWCVQHLLTFLLALCFELLHLFLYVLLCLLDWFL